MVKDDVVVYNDSRIIEEMSGLLRPDNQLSLSLYKKIKQDILPKIKSNVWFKKKSAIIVTNKIKGGQSALILPPFTEKPIDLQKIKAKKANTFRKQWLNERNN